MPGVSAAMRATASTTTLVLGAFGHIHMVDLQGLHARLRPSSTAMDEVLQESAFIRGRHVSAFEAKLSATHPARRPRCRSAMAPTPLPRLTRTRYRPWRRGHRFPLHCHAEVVAEVGATLVFADIDPRSTRPAPLSAPARPNQGGHGGPPLWAMRRHGRPVPWAQKHGLHLVDNAQSLGSVYCGVRAWPCWHRRRGVHQLFPANRARRRRGHHRAKHRSARASSSPTTVPSAVPPRSASTPVSTAFKRPSTTSNSTITTT